VLRAHIPNPTGAGGFAKGQSGNPYGRPRSETQLALEARKHALGALKRVVWISKKGEPKHAVQLHAALAILDRGYGRPAATLELSGTVTQQLDLFANLPVEQQRQVRDVLKAIEDQSAENGLGEPMDVIDGEVEDTVEVGMSDSDTAAEVP
jgi:hypothetical protein